MRSVTSEKERGGAGAKREKTSSFAELVDRRPKEEKSGIKIAISNASHSSNLEGGKGNYKGETATRGVTKTLVKTFPAKIKGRTTRRTPPTFRALKERGISSEKLI